MRDKNIKVIKIYDQIAERYAADCDPLDSEEGMTFPGIFISYLKPKSKILDIGCGTGLSSGWFVINGMDSEGVDLSSSMISIAKRNYPSLSFHLADIRTFRPRESPDAVWAGYSLFHMEKGDFEKTLDNIKRYLKRGGIFGLVMQEGEGEVEFPEPFKPDEIIYVHLYTVSELSGILKEHGFKMIEHKIRKPIRPIELNFNKLLLIARNF